MGARRAEGVICYYSFICLFVLFTIFILNETLFLTVFSKLLYF